jgi:hypothetical protein
VSETATSGGETLAQLVPAAIEKPPLPLGVMRVEIRAEYSSTGAVITLMS